MYLIGPLDYESNARYYVTIEAFDSGFPSRSAFVNVTVNVVDINDCPPVLSPASSIVHVKENTEPVIKLIQVKLKFFL